MAVSDIRDIAFRLKSYDVPPIQGTDYVCVTSPEVIGKLEADTAWANYHIYTEKGIDNVYSGEIGRVYGVRFFNSTLTRVSAGSINCATSVGHNAASAGNGTDFGAAPAHAAFFMGRDFLGAVELDGNIKTFLNAGATKSDPLNQITIYGWKANFIAKVLNASAGIVAWSGVNATAFYGCANSARYQAGTPAGGATGTGALLLGYPGTSL